MKVTVLKPHTYGTRQLLAGDEYELPDVEAVLLVVDGKATFGFEVGKARPKPVTIDDLRMQAEKLGIDIDRRWGRARLQYEITARSE